MTTAGSVAKLTAAGNDLRFPEDQLIDFYRRMVEARVIDERCLTLQRQGRIGFYVPLQGQEAAQVGCAWALEPADWIFPAYRELGVALVRGIPFRLLIDQFIGNSGDELKGRQMPNHYGYRRFNFVTASSPVGTQISHAVGAAMAAQRKHDPIITIAFFGDGTTSSNDFHAGLNFAGVFQTPTVFFCQNNQWAISLPRDRQTRSATLAAKAEAYGFPGVVVDGTDVRAVYTAVREARHRALAGEGPTLIEAQVYRLGPHSTSDDPRRYRSDDELRAWKEKDPIARLKHELLGSGRWTEEQDAQLWEDTKAAIGRDLAAAEATPPVEPSSLFNDVYAELPALLREEQAHLESLLNPGSPKP
ncbi:MAG TPA: thiamine pyrophosphate-dependent dehydrogenase E1 component subunit alpha [Thermoplasmata archaeon]|nr:thiamine pyrophosphate-dependent dehydrogenase E1 component subunit alpha [Thermoplasmata archaeon]